MADSRAFRLGLAVAVAAALGAVLWSAVPMGTSSSCGVAIEEAFTGRTVLVNPTLAQRAADPQGWSGFRSTAVPSPCRHVARSRLGFSGAVVALDALWFLGFYGATHRPRRSAAVASPT